MATGKPPAQDVTPQSGLYHFLRSINATAELYQEIDVSSYATGIDAGTQAFSLWAMYRIGMVMIHQESLNIEILVERYWMITIPAIY
ncbi:MAG: hypothetical protein R2795_20625 [Saprospiraceae bacterium]